jgi:hypothetical protein
MNEYGIKSNKTIYDIIERNGRDKIIPNKKFSVNEKYFEDIDTEEKSYWLGFLYADGYVRIKNNKSGELKLKLCLKDKEHIELFRNCIKSTHKIVDGKSCIIIGDKKYESMYSTFSIYNTRLVNDILKLGCLNNKTFKIRLPKLREDMIRHFIRGYFDGDGCVSINKNNSTTCCITSNKQFLCDIFSILSYGNIKKRGNIYDLRFHHRDNINMFYDLIYNDSNIFLKRKKETFDKAISISNSKIKNKNK